MKHDDDEDEEETSDPEDEEVKPLVMALAAECRRAFYIGHGQLLSPRQGKSNNTLIRGKSSADVMLHHYGPWQSFWRTSLEAENPYAGDSVTAPWSGSRPTTEEQRACFEAIDPLRLTPERTISPLRVAVALSRLPLALHCALVQAPPQPLNLIRSRPTTPTNHHRTPRRSIPRLLNNIPQLLVPWPLTLRRLRGTSIDNPFL